MTPTEPSVEQDAPEWTFAPSRERVTRNTGAFFHQGKFVSLLGTVHSERLAAAMDENAHLRTAYEEAVRHGNEDREAWFAKYADLDTTTDPEAWRKAGHTCERETLDGVSRCPHPSHEAKHDHCATCDAELAGEHDCATATPWAAERTARLEAAERERDEAIAHAAEFENGEAYYRLQRERDEARVTARENRWYVERRDEEIAELRAALASISTLPDHESQLWEHGIEREAATHGLLWDAVRIARVAIAPTPSGGKDG